MRTTLGILGLSPFASLALSHFLGDLTISVVLVLTIAVSLLGITSPANARAGHTH
ncbi:hypothetical protein ACVWYO_002752 [Sphingomonas sp. UYP23]